jgi:putative transposase
MRYIELNPARAQMVTRPEEYRWSSYGINAWGDQGWLQHHEEYLRLGPSPEARGHAYRKLFRAHLSEEDLHLIRKAAHYYCQPVGNVRFREQIERRYGLQLGQMERGRPRKQDNELLKN